VERCSVLGGSFHQAKLREDFLPVCRVFEKERLNFHSIGINDVLVFLKRFSGFSKSRVRTGVSALKFFLRIYNRLDLVNNPLLDTFSKGAQNLAPMPCAARHLGGHLESYSNACVR
jgi:hypothetical protein